MQTRALALKDALSECPYSFMASCSFWWEASLLISGGECVKLDRHHFKSILVHTAYVVKRKQLKTIFVSLSFYYSHILSMAFANILWILMNILCVWRMTVVLKAQTCSEKLTAAAVNVMHYTVYFPKWDSVVFMILFSLRSGYWAVLLGHWFSHQSCPSSPFTSLDLKTSSALVILTRLALTCLAALQSFQTLEIPWQTSWSAN